MRAESDRTELLNDHAEIETLLVALLEAFESGDRSVATAAFEAFDRRLSAHLEFEEDFLVPMLAGIDREAADRILSEHRIIRAAVETLAIADNLHLSRASEVRRLVEILRAHAHDEERVLYWLADRLDDSSEVGAGLAAIA